ncbi:cellulose biosynthesis cyclic di-GMP-binding regulatory protein BcsB [Enterococcus sp. DIV0242_7C1]|uniref:Cellulose synthase catalytic subunit n=1 Tax=Candidatus Enterococcus dunnyi TaxID=1834192 RepID=A0A200JDK8_9ENTE|nr:MULTISPECIES: cellulose biosynthesis cyclic di-GMP-binding regulatory protein BcsB [unclassified Enterococcus]MBO0469393.1 cellulose biosynthesis cyclic di-GMP-binding regulatory protein BcsB [Enterococcus sp. DIV0242_7C1]OUZ35312.1 hypothetical protein A5889_000788 [Enterococcus sp. 9D6_DIV0238]
MKKMPIILISFLSLVFVLGSRTVFAETSEQENHTFTQPFQNPTTSLTGTSVKATMYFTKIDYWDVKKATLNLKFQITQLENSQESDLTVAVNGVKFFSFRPKNTTEIQEQEITIPLDLVQGTNTLTVEGQIINHSVEDSYTLIETPANWLTIYEGSNVNFQYDLILPEASIHSFYNHFIGADTIANAQSVILVPEDATEKELSAATYALAGVSRIITTKSELLQLDSLNGQHDQPYQLIIGLYDKIPKEYRQQIDAKNLENEAVLKRFESNGKHILVATSKDEALLIRAGRYIGNEELMTQTEKTEKRVTKETLTFTSSLEFDGTYPLTSTGDKLSGVNHQEQVYFVNLPVDQNNANGSSVHLNFKYADNLDFDNSLVTVSVNDRPIGSQRLSAAKANGDEFLVEFPNDLGITDSFVLKVSFDLVVENPENIRSNQTPWAYIENTSNAFIKTQELDTMLFTNYPNMFVKSQSFADLGVVLPEKLNKDYFKALTNIFNLIGNYTQSNVGEITYYKTKPKESALSTHNLIVLGTPNDNALIKSLNNDLFFAYDKSFATFVSNEKLSIEEDYGKSIGTAQLLFSPFESKAAMLILTGTTPENVFLASTQIATEKNTSTYKGDALVVDNNYKRYDYRFKKEVSQSQQENLGQRLINNQKLGIYLVVFLLVVMIVGLSAFFILKKDTKGGNDDETE